VSEIASRLSAEYEVESDEAAKDVEELLVRLLDAGLVEAVEP
jgi:hypothetical protein